MTSASGDPLDRAVLARNLALVDAAERAAAAMARGGVTAVAIKGVALTDVFYAPHERRMDDADLLIHPRDGRAAARALTAAGFQRVVVAARPLGNLVHYGRAFVTAQGLPMDLHTRLAPWPMWSVDVDGLFERAVVHPDLRSARRLGDEDLLLHVAINQALDEYATDDRPARDVERLVARGVIDWDRVVARARAWRCETALWLTLRHGREHRSAGVPAEVVGALAPGALRRRYLGGLIDPSAAQPYRGGPGSRRLRQLRVGAVVHDRPHHFVAAAARFAAVRGIDWALASTRR